tara:strand:+ start:722 stop:1450 length:729 start_codon:yes stop_codon:yes gene_type:complete
MFGFIVTTHFNNYKTIKKCLDLLINSIPIDSYIILYVNETTCKKVLNIKNEYTQNNFEVIYISDQKKNNGLTGTWNQGINRLLSKELIKTNNFNCKVITILGHDTFVNSSITYILDAALKAQENKELSYFGPLYKSSKENNFLLWQDEFKYKSYVNKNNCLYFKYIVGSFFTIPVNTLIKNIFYKSLFSNNHQYFDEDKYPFGYNEVDFNKRLRNIKGKSIIIPECIIEHTTIQSWKLLEIV